jgi:hypothetical protein
MRVGARKLYCSKAIGENERMNLSAFFSLLFSHSFECLG